MWPFGLEGNTIRLHLINPIKGSNETQVATYSLLWTTMEVKNLKAPCLPIWNDYCPGSSLPDTREKKYGEKARDQVKSFHAGVLFLILGEKGFPCFYIIPGGKR
jgi:hypothetical protein